MREKMLAISRRIRTAATDGFAVNSQAAPVMLAIADIIDEELEAKAPGGEDSGVAPRSTDERLAAVLEPVDWPCRLEDLRPGPAIIVATPRDQGHLIFKTEYTENEKIVAYNEAGEFLSLHKGTIVQAVYLTWRER